MKTLSPYPFNNITPYHSRTPSKTTLQKHSNKSKSEHQKPPPQTLKQPSEQDFVQRVSKKYLYFHETPTKSNQSINKETIAFPYNALNLCYFQKNFIDIKQKKLQKRNLFNSNQEIRSFLNARLKTQPVKSRQLSPQKQIFVGKKNQEKRIHNEQNLKNKIFFSIEKYQFSKNTPNSTKTNQSQKLPQVLKIKAKKAYFMGLYKGMGKQSEKQHSTIEVKKTPQPEKLDEEEEPNPFELKYRSRTQDNISMIKAIRQQIKGTMKVRDRKRLSKYTKEEVFEPWEVDWEGESVHDSRELNPYQKAFE